jgi:thioredoxin 1
VAEIKEAWTVEDFELMVLAAERPVVVDFWAAWCGPCIAMAPVFVRLAEQHPDVDFVKVDTDRAPDIARLAGIRSLPTFGLFWQGQVRDILIGGRTPAQLDKRIRWLTDIAAGKGLIARLLGR